MGAHTRARTNLTPSTDAPNLPSFWVCEKSDGIRVLVLILFNSVAQTQDVFLVRPCGLSDRIHRCVLPLTTRRHPQLDRMNTYHQVFGLLFPHHEGQGVPLENTILDGELVVDVSKRDGRVRHWGGGAESTNGAEDGRVRTEDAPALRV